MRSKVKLVRRFLSPKLSVDKLKCNGILLFLAKKSSNPHLRIDRDYRECRKSMKFVKSTSLNYRVIKAGQFCICQNHRVS